MPLSEFLRMARGELESGHQKPFLTHLCSRSENDLVELVWENGQIVMQSQSSRATRSPTRNNLVSNPSRVRDVGIGDVTTLRFRKFGGVESILDDVASVVPSGDFDLSQDDEMVPWLSYPIDDALGQDYASELLPEISGVTADGMSTRNSFVSVDKSSCDQTVSKLHSGGSSLKAASSSKDRLLCSWDPHLQTSDALESRVSDIISNNNNNNNNNNSSNQQDDSMKMERQNNGPRTNHSSFLNFSHFSRPANLVKASLPSSDGIPPTMSSGVDKMETKEKSTAIERFTSTSKDIDSRGPSAMLSMVNSREPVANASKETCSNEKTKNLFQETSFKNDKPQILSYTDSSSRGVPDGERTVEPMVASSSVGSGNSGDIASWEQTHNSKRKFHDIEESECRINDGKKRASVRGSKRSRAAAVHNLSERRRRDRINEKMRALQELIPNCNKADKASMLDEAIEYLKTLQLQFQIMSMGVGLCMPPTLFPTGMQHMHPTHVPLFSPMGVGVGPSMGYGIGMLNMSGGSSGCPIFPVSPMQLGHFPSPFPGIAHVQRNLPVFGHPSQGLPNSVSRVPFVPLTGLPSVTSTMGTSALRNGSNSEVPRTSSVMNPRDPVTPMESQSMCYAEDGCQINDKSDQIEKFPRSEHGHAFPFSTRDMLEVTNKVRTQGAPQVLPLLQLTLAKNQGVVSRG